MDLAARSRVIAVQDHRVADDHTDTIDDGLVVMGRQRTSASDSRGFWPASTRDRPGPGCVRKLRWKRPGMGKRGGLRLIYFVRFEPNEFWMLTIYAKARL